MKDEIKVLLVDDHQIILDGLNALLSLMEKIRVIGEALDGKEALQILDILSPDVVLMDIDMPVMNGFDAAKAIKTRENPPRIIILSMHQESALIKNLVEAGVDGYLLKNSGKEDVENAIRTVAKGEKYFSSDVTLALISKKPFETESRDKVMLTERELEIIKLIAGGLTNKEIGEQLFISHRTVDTHRTNMMKKIGATNIAGLISFAMRNHLLD